MTADKLALTSRLFSRIVTFVLALIIGIVLGEVIPLWSANPEVQPVTVRTHSGCRR
jgi:hypothetical protein